MSVSVIQQTPAETTYFAPIDPNKKDPSLPEGEYGYFFPDIDTLKNEVRVFEGNFTIGSAKLASELIRQITENGGKERFGIADIRYTPIRPSENGQNADIASGMYFTLRFTQRGNENELKSKRKIFWNLCEKLQNEQIQNDYTRKGIRQRSMSEMTIDEYEEEVDPIVYASIQILMKNNFGNR